MNLDIFDLSGKVAVVTGGNSAIGRAIAEGIAEAGADVVICARRFALCQKACTEMEKFGIRALPVKCDVSNVDDVNSMVDTVMKEFGKVDILVNDAGVGERGEPVTKITADDWDRVMDINARGTFLCSRAVTREMKKQGSGKIINIASVCAFVNGQLG